MAKKIEIGTTCPALTKENYSYMLSGDCSEYCICSLTDKPCIGRTITDPNDQSSQFFSRAKCGIDKEELKYCPVYGVSKETFAAIVTDRSLHTFKEKLKNFQ